MRKQVYFQLASVAVLSASSVAFAQESNPPVPSVPAPVPGAPVAARPAYGQQQTQPVAVPSPTPAPAPLPVPAQPTAAAPVVAMPPYIPYGIPDEDRVPNHSGSTYIPVDSWIYTSMLRLYSLGYANTLFIGVRPWTRQSVMHVLDESEDDIRESDGYEAKEIFTAVKRELRDEEPNATGERAIIYGAESVYFRGMGIGGPILRDSFHFGQTIANDYGRPYQTGFNSLIGATSVNEYGRFSLFVRGEYQHAPSAVGYSQALSNTLSINDGVAFDVNGQRQSTIPNGPISSQNPFRLIEATLSFHVLGHELSAGKQDDWLGPGVGGALAYSNNAEPIYSVRINRVEPLHIPYLSAVLGPVRYDFMYGSLKGHTDPNHPYTHTEMFSFEPTSNFQFAFTRTIIFGGAAHAPVTLHTFLKGFVNLNDTTAALKVSRDDPGARYSDFTASYRLPFVRKYLTFYVDSFDHDDVTPISAPRRAAYRTGLYLSHFPYMPKLDLRVEGASTDPKVAVSSNGIFFYTESIQRQAYTNKGFLFGDAIGREGKGGNAWLTYHLSGSEWVQVSYMNKKNDKDFPTLTNGGTTQNQFKVQLVKRFLHDQLEVNSWVQYEAWKAPLYMTGKQTNTIGTFQLTYYPGLHTHQAQ